MEDEKLNYKKLSDADLIQRFCSDPPDHEAFTELWKRYEPTLRRYARRITSMCPPSYSVGIFAEDVFDKTQDKVMRKLGQFKATARFSTWLYKIVETTAIEVRRKTEGRDRKGPRIRVPVRDEEYSDEYAVFRDKVKHDPFHAASMLELRTSMRPVLRDYAGSKGGYESLEVVCLYVIEECPVPEIARRKGTYDKKIYRTLEHDYEALKASFAQAGLSRFLKP